MTSARQALRRALLADDGLKTAAHARLREIGAGPTPIRDRCHIARLEEAALKEALGE
jgi:hypothetical protein